MRKFITELRVAPSIESLIPLYCDNNGAIVKAKKPKSHQKSIHIERHFQIIIEIIGRGNVAL